MAAAVVAAENAVAVVAVFVVIPIQHPAASVHSTVALAVAVAFLPTISAARMPIALAALPFPVHPFQFPATFHGAPSA